MKLKTLRELADEVGFPFDASLDLYADKSIQVFHCIGIAPDGNALGWYTEGTMSWINKAVTENKSSCWTLVTPRKKGDRYMNIIEAVRSGKHFKRKSFDHYLTLDMQYYRLNQCDILATDWEIEERKIEITESEFDAASADLCSRDSIKELKKRLFEK